MRALDPQHTVRMKVEHRVLKAIQDSLSSCLLRLLEDGIEVLDELAEKFYPFNRIGNLA